MASMMSLVLFGCSSGNDGSKTPDLKVIGSGGGASGACQAYDGCTIVTESAVQSAFGIDPGAGKNLGNSSGQVSSGQTSTGATCSYTKGTQFPGLDVSLMCSGDGTATPDLAKTNANDMCTFLKSTPTVVSVPGVGDGAYFSSCASVYDNTAFGLFAVKGRFMVSLQFTAKATAPADAQAHLTNLANGAFAQLGL
jgi:hypothetical protein